MQSPQAATVPIFWVLMRFWLPIRPGGLPYAGAVPMPGAFPHTFWQIPTGRLSPHTFSAGSAIQSASSKESDPKSGETSVRLRKSPTNPTPTDTLNLRYISANQAPAKSRKSYRPATGGGAGTSCTYARACKYALHLHGHARTCTYAHTCMYAHTFTAMRAPARPWSYHFMPILTSPGTPSPRPAAGLRKSPTGSVTQVHWTSGRSTQMRVRPTHSSSLRRRGGHGRRRRCVAATCRRQGGASTCMSV